MTNRHVLIAGAMAIFAALVFVKIQTRDELQPAADPRPSARPPADQAGSTAKTRVATLPLASQPPPARDRLEGQPALNPPDPAELSTNEPPPLAGLLGASNTRPEDEAKIVLDLLKTYRRLLGAYPAGEDNRQFVNALLGANKDKLPLLPRDHPRLNAQGELVDAWGTPFFFHLNSRTSIEVRSAGADRLFYTADDIVAGKPTANLQQSVVAEENAPEN